MFNISLFQLWLFLVGFDFCHLLFGLIDSLIDKYVFKKDYEREFWVNKLKLENE